MSIEPEGKGREPEIKSPSSFRSKLAEVRGIMTQSDANEDQKSKVIKWFRDFLSGDPIIIKYYNVFEEDIETDLVNYVKCSYWQSNSKDHQKVLIYEAKLVWRLLMRRYAWFHAMEVWNRLRATDSWVWSGYRLTNLLLPRLGVAIFAGFLAILGSGDLTEFVTRVSTDAWPRTGVIAVSLALALWLTFTEVQRRVGRSARRATVRTLLIFLGGLLQTIALTAVVVAGSKYFQKLGPLDCCGKLLLASIALAVGHIVQLFWEEDSIGDPW